MSVCGAMHGGGGVCCTVQKSVCPSALLEVERSLRSTARVRAAAHTVWYTIQTEVPDL
jgi:hypothetical protein